MEQVTTIGLDLAKRVFQAHGIDAVGFGRLIYADDVPARLRHLLAVVEQHALMEEALERFVRERVKALDRGLPVHLCADAVGSRVHR